MELNLENLTPEEIELLMSLAQVSRKRVEKPKQTIKGYKLKINERCKFCGTITTLFFDMIPYENNCLISQRTIDIEMRDGDKEEFRDRRFCSHCREFLNSKTKEELVEIAWSVILGKL